MIGQRKVSAMGDRTRLHNGWINQPENAHLDPDEVNLSAASRKIYLPATLEV